MFRYKLMMFWGSKWRTYFGLYYARTFAVAYAALEQYNFPIAKNQGWAIEDMDTKDVTFSFQEWIVNAKLAHADTISHEVSDRESPLEHEDSEMGLGVLFIHREKSRLLQPRPKRLG